MPIFLNAAFFVIRVILIFDRSQFFNLNLTFIERKKNEILLRTFIIFISFRYYTLNNDRKLNLLD